MFAELKDLSTRKEEEVKLEQKLRLHITQVGDDTRDSVISAKTVLERIKDIDRKFLERAEQLKATFATKRIDGK